MKIRAFDVTGACAVLFFGAVVAADLDALRHPRGEISLTVAPDELRQGFREGVSWYGFYLREVKIGFSSIDRRRSGSGFRIRVHSLFRPTVLGRVTAVESRLNADFDRQMTLRRIDLSVQSGPSHFAAIGEVGDGRMRLQLSGGGMEHETSVPIDRPPALDLTIRPALLSGDPEIGRRYTYETFDPLGMGVKTTAIEYLGRDVVEILGQRVNAHLLQQESGGHMVRAWVNDLGEVLQEEMPFGIVAMRETEADATYGFGKGATVAPPDLQDSEQILDLLGQFAAATVPSPNPPPQATTGQHDEPEANP